MIEPCKDASDLMLILQNYLDADNSERLYSEAGQLLENPNFDYECAGVPTFSLRTAMLSLGAIRFLVAAIIVLTAPFH